MQPERHIEKRLRAFARRRRDQAGAGFGLHPATRRMLHGEVARQFRPTEGKRAPWWRSWAGFGPRVAFATGTLAGVVIIGLLLYPPTSEKLETPVTLVREPAMSADELKALPAPVSIAPALPATAAAPAPEQEKLADADTAARARRTLEPAERAVTLYAFTPSAASKDKSAPDFDALLAGNDRTDSKKQMQPPAARSTAPASSLPVARLASAPNEPAPSGVTKPYDRAKGELRMDADAETKSAMAEKPVQELARVSGARGGSAPGAAAARAAKPDSSDGKATWGMDGSIGQAYFRTETASPSPGFVRNDSLEALSGARPTAPSPLLASFQLEQRGAEIRIVDADGSVYSGTGTFADAALPLAAADSRRTQSSRGATGSSYGVATSKLDTPRASTPPTLNFVVRGTNATLRQGVVFTGNLQQAVFIQQVPASNQAANLALRFQNQAPTQNQLQKSQLNGRARLANGAEIEINAIALPQDGTRAP